MEAILIPDIFERFWIPETEFFAWTIGQTILLYHQQQIVRIPG